MSIRVRFLCGHEGTVKETDDAVPVCPCGETRIARTFARPPRFTGACSGPYAQMRPVSPARIGLDGKES